MTLVAIDVCIQPGCTYGGSLVIPWVIVHVSHIIVLLHHLILILKMTSTVYLSNGMLEFISLPSIVECPIVLLHIALRVRVSHVLLFLLSSLTRIERIH